MLIGFFCVFRGEGLFLLFFCAFCVRIDMRFEILDIRLICASSLFLCILCEDISLPRRRHNVSSLLVWRNKLNIRILQGDYYPKRLYDFRLYDYLFYDYLHWIGKTHHSFTHHTFTFF